MPYFNSIRASTTYRYHRWNGWVIDRYKEDTADCGKPWCQKSFLTTHSPMSPDIRPALGMDEPRSSCLHVTTQPMIFFTHPRNLTARRKSNPLTEESQPSPTIPTMMRLATTAAMLLLLLFLHGGTASAPESQECAADGTCTPIAGIPTAKQQQNGNGNKAQCGVYMAPSTLGEDTSMGIYTGIPLKEKDIIRFPEIAVPILFRGFDKHPDGTLLLAWWWGSFLLLPNWRCRWPGWNEA
jgi:hypothetical protein